MDRLICILKAAETLRGGRRKENQGKKGRRKQKERRRRKGGRGGKGRQMALGWRCRVYQSQLSSQRGGCVLHQRGDTLRFHFNKKLPPPGCDLWRTHWCNHWCNHCSDTRCNQRCNQRPLQLSHLDGGGGGGSSPPSPSFSFLLLPSSSFFFLLLRPPPSHPHKIPSAIDDPSVGFFVFLFLSLFAV